MMVWIVIASEVVNDVVQADVSASDKANESNHEDENVL